jgi:hypothetical protein
MKKNQSTRVENDLNTMLTEGKLNYNKPVEEAINQLIPKYEVRIQATQDPIKEETKMIQKYVKETKERYLRYVEEEPNEDE